MQIASKLGAENADKIAAVPGGEYRYCIYTEDHIVDGLMIGHCTSSIRNVASTPLTSFSGSPLRPWARGNANPLTA